MSAEVARHSTDVQPAKQVGERLFTKADAAEQSLSSRLYLRTLSSQARRLSFFTQVHVQNNFVLDARSHGKVTMWSLLPPPLTCAVATTMCRVCKVLARLVILM